MSNVKLNQIIAVEKGLKERTNKEITAIYQGLSKTEPMQGISRTYQPVNEDGEKLPPENKYVQVKVSDKLVRLRSLMSELADATFTKDNGNTIAKADIVIDGVVLAKDVPPTFMLYLEKAVTDVRTVLASLPKLDPAEKWVYNDQQGFYESVPSQTSRTKKVQEFVIAAPATAQHPAQVKEVTNDVQAGIWTTVKFSATMEPSKVAALVEKADALLKAIKYAREAANSNEVPQVKIADKLFGYIFD